MSAGRISSQHLTMCAPAVQVWLVRNTCRPSMRAQPVQMDEVVDTLQSAVQQGEELMMGLSRKFLRNAAAFLNAI